MKNLRSHIIKTCIIALVCSGLMVGFAKPTNAAQTNEDFANWLQSITKKVDTPELQRKLRSLKKSKANLSQLIKKASQIVSQNNEDFNIPLKNAADDIQQILLVEWTQYQTGNAMAAIPAVETSKPSVAPQHQKMMVGGIAPLTTCCKSAKPQWVTATTGQSCFYTLSNVVPMVSGIAIGAP